MHWSRIWPCSPTGWTPAARVDSALVTLLAGRSHTFHVSGRDLDEVALTARPVLRSVNDLIATEPRRV